MATILVPTCSKYSDAWGPFIGLLRAFWPDRPWPVVLVTDGSAGDWPEGAVSLGRDAGWCPNLLEGIRRVGDPEILLMQEDFFLSGKTDTAYLAAALEILRKDKSVGCFRVFPCPGPDSVLDPDHGEVAQRASYRISCQAAWWRADFISSILSRCDTAASFELQGTKIAWEKRDRVLSVRRERDPWPLQYICSAISRGRWNPDALALCDRLGVPVDRSRRPVDPPAR